MSNIDVNHLRALVLNANYMPVDVMPLMTIKCIPAALTRCYNSKPTCSVHYEWPIQVQSGRGEWSINYPSVIVRKNTNFYHRDGVHLTHETLYYRDNGKCAYCGEDTPIKRNREQWGTMDHVVPESQGGEKEWDNIVWACPPCNFMKDNKPAKGRWKPRNTGWTPTYWELLRRRKKFPLFVQDKRWLEFLPEWDAETMVTMEID